MLLDFHTRKLYARPLRIKKSYQLYETLYEIMKENDLVGKIKLLIADGEKGFQGPQFETLFLKAYNVKFIPVHKVEIYPHYRLPNYDKLGVINRVMRTPSLSFVTWLMFQEYLIQFLRMQCNIL